MTSNVAHICLNWLLSKVPYTNMTTEHLFTNSGQAIAQGQNNVLLILRKNYLNMYSFISKILLYVLKVLIMYRTFSMLLLYVLSKVNSFFC